MHRLLIGLICLLALIFPARASAQTPRDARVQVTVVDPAGLIVPEATVTLEHPSAGGPFHNAPPIVNVRYFPRLAAGSHDAPACAAVCPVDCCVAA